MRLADTGWSWLNATWIRTRPTRNERVAKRLLRPRLMHDDLSRFWRQSLLATSPAIAQFPSATPRLPLRLAVSPSPFLHLSPIIIPPLTIRPNNTATRVRNKFRMLTDQGPVCASLQTPSCTCHVPLHRRNVKPRHFPSKFVYATIPWFQLFVSALFELLSTTVLRRDAPASSGWREIRFPISGKPI